MTASRSWTGSSVAKAIEGPATSLVKDSFATARDGTEQDTAPAEQQRGGTGDDHRAPEPPDPTRFAEIRVQAGRRSLQHLLERTL